MQQTPFFNVVIEYGFCLLGKEAFITSQYVNKTGTPTHNSDTDNIQVVEYYYYGTIEGCGFCII